MVVSRVGPALSADIMAVMMKEAAEAVDRCWFGGRGWMEIFSAGPVESWMARSVVGMGRQGNMALRMLLRLDILEDS